MAAVCARTGCAESASALLVFDPEDGVARLVDVNDERLGAMRLCSGHADRVVVPGGWVLTDDRTRVPEGVASLLGATAGGEAAPAPESPLLKRAFRVIS